MKVCPKCKMTIDAHCECPVCKNDITNEPYSEKKYEKYVLNKYFWGYLFKKQLFQTVCVAVFIARLIIKHIEINWYYLIASALLIVACVLESFFKNAMAEAMSWKYTDDYIDSVYKISKYASGILGVVFAFLW